MSWHGYLRDGEVDNRRLVSDAREQAKHLHGPTKRLVHLLCNAIERLLERIGRP